MNIDARILYWWNNTDRVQHKKNEAEKFKTDGYQDGYQDG